MRTRKRRSDNRRASFDRIKRTHQTRSAAHVFHLKRSHSKKIPVCAFVEAVPVQEEMFALKIEA